MWTTYKRKSTGDISPTFLLLRFITNNIWIAYAVELDSLLFLINNVVTVVSSAFIGFYKVREMLKHRRDFKELDDVEELEEKV